MFLPNDVLCGLKMLFRNKGWIFFTFAFPILFFLVFGYLLGAPAGAATLYYVDHDNSSTSQAFISALNDTGAVNLKDGASMDLAQTLKDGKISVYVEIPQGFGNSVMAAREGNSSPGDLQIYYDKSQTTSLATVSVIEQVMNGFNMQIEGAKPVMNATAQDEATANISYLDFLLPGIIGMAIMSTSLYGTVGLSASNRAKGIFRKLATTPISAIEWNASKIIYQTIVMVITVALCLLVGWLAFGIHPAINLATVIFVIVGSMAFAGLGMLIASFVKDEEMAMNAANMVGFPLMFLSGSLFPVSQMPWFLQIIADISPLTYLNNGLRAAMITGDNQVILTSMVIVCVLAAILFGLGVVTQKWKDD
jgi:ABC-2 type transport system permease protein